MKDDETTRARVAPVALIACCIGALVVSACWKTKRNPLYCDGTAAYKCAAGLSCNPTTFACEEPLDGFMGDLGPDLAHACTGNASCTVATAPICDDVTKLCRACTNATDCMSLTGKPVCAAAGACVECASDVDCAPQNKHCDLPTNTCVACNANADCTSGACLADQSCATVGDVVIVDNQNGSTCTGMTHGDVNGSLLSAERRVGQLAHGFDHRRHRQHDATYHRSRFTTATTMGPKSIVGPGEECDTTSDILGSRSMACRSTIASGTAALSIAGVIFKRRQHGAGVKLAQAASPGSSGVGDLTIARSLIENSGGDGVDSTMPAL